MREASGAKGATMGQYLVGLVGESNYQQSVARLRPGDPIEFEHETSNPHDPLAVRALGPDGEVVGYLARDSWLRELVHDGEPILAAVKQIKGNRGKRGVVLDVATRGASLRDPEDDFGDNEGDPDVDLAPGGMWERTGLAALSAAQQREKRGGGCAIMLALGLGLLGLADAWA